jgi:hypothetical protein
MMADQSARYFVAYRDARRVLPFAAVRTAEPVGLCFVFDGHSLYGSHLSVRGGNTLARHLPFPPGLQGELSLAEESQLLAEARRWWARRRVAGRRGVKCA